MKLASWLSGWMDFGKKSAQAGFDPASSSPRYLFLSINKRCNLKCEHCVFWQDDDSDKAAYLSQADRRRILGEFRDMNPSGAVVICGGESMLDLEDYFDVCRACRELGLTCLSVVNGTRIRSAEMADRMISEGPHEISISLNSHRPDLHDRTRGVSGAFEKATRAARLLREARDRVGDGSTRIYIMGLVFDENYRDLPAFYDYVLNDLKADKLKLNFLQPSFGGPEVDSFFASHHHVDPDELLTVLRECEERFDLGLNPVWMRQVHMYFTSLRDGHDLEKGWSSSVQTRGHICSTYERNMMVDHYGMTRLCFSTEFRGEAMKKHGDLRRFWTGANDIRDRMRQCNKFCGISHSVRNTSSTVRPARPHPPVVFE